jgi:hypothetical protein
MTGNEGESVGLTKECLLFQRLYISREDLRFAEGFATHLLKKGWHFAAWERRRNIYIQQAAFTSAFVTSYTRPFTQSKGWPTFPSRLVKYTKPEAELHEHLLVLRHQIYAHSDSSRHKVLPIRIIGKTSAIVASPHLRLTKKELQLGIAMIGKLLTSVGQELEQLMTHIDQ